MTEEMRVLLRRAGKGDNDACERLIEENSGLIWSIVRRYCGRGVEAEDLYQLGCLGFLKAVRGFDQAFGTEFSTYAVPKISGEIRRFLRDDGTIKVGRTLKQRAAQIAAVRERLRGVLGREPVLSELAAETGLTAEDIAAAELSAAAPESLQQETAEGLTLESVLRAEDGEETMLRTLALRQAVEALPEKERTIIALRYFRAYTQQECAAVVHISQVQVSRLEKRALKQLRTLVGAGE
ncbi:MAG: sigma-70 family RNA polymerase sigma factor [Clostridiales bacterium]|nr:sigma-70 family RNA polymerase sigma factor [bacterium 210917-SL.2.15]MCI5844068.1 sigma-70 family RNA polymerase sigma factor [Clostridiales bacterium]MDY4036661.1 sigma-70 family RNA polymerase sigma factor [Candidatus Pseudoscilispira sp.]